MKFKVGDKVRLIEQSSATYGFKVGEICKIVDISNKGDYYPIKIEKEGIYGFVSSKHIKKTSEQSYTYEDLKKSPMGTKITFKDGRTLVKTCKEKFENCEDVSWADELANFEDKYYGRIIKIEEPTYTTVYKAKLEILDEVEKRYLRGVIRPFRDDVEVIRKLFSRTKGEYYIQIRYKDEPSTNLPYFESQEMYKNMETEKKYTLEELGL